MIKGVNRQMIEVTHTGSPYFERAYLVVRASAGQPTEETLHRLAGKVVQQADSYAGLRKQRRWLWMRRIVCAIGYTGLGAVVMWLILQL